MTSNSREGNKKKPYQKPALRVYGDIRTMTQSVPKGTGKVDALKGQNKTH